MLKHSKSLAIGLVVLGILGIFLLKDAAETTAETLETPVAAEQQQPESAPVPAETVSPEAATASESLLAAPAAMTEEVAAAMKDRVLGSETAPVTIIEYASMTCSHCADFATKILPEIKKRLIDTGKAKLIYRDFPLDNFALKAAMMARCLPADKYFNIVEVIFSNQERWAKNEDPLEGLAQLGSLAGMDADAFKACTENTALETAILAGVQEAQRKYEVQSTPTFIFNDGAEKLKGSQAPEKFEEIVNKLTGK